MMFVFINPGHDINLDSGAVSPRTGWRECDIARAVGLLLQKYLEAAYCRAEVLQSDNLMGENPDCPCVVDAANVMEADVFVSLHCNAANQVARGTETLIYSKNGWSERLAVCIQRQIVTAVGTFDRGIKERPDLAVLRETIMPAVLVELAFIDNAEDEALLDTHLDEFARAIARGITDFSIERHIN